MWAIFSGAFPARTLAAEPRADTLPSLMQSPDNLIDHLMLRHQRLLMGEKDNSVRGRRRLDNHMSVQRVDDLREDIPIMYLIPRAVFSPVDAPASVRTTASSSSLMISAMYPLWL